MTAGLQPTQSPPGEAWDPAVDEFDPLEAADDLELMGSDRPFHSLHLWYTAVVLVLIVTGLPIQFPDLRAKLIGGYGRPIATVHEWVGVAMTVLPVLAFAVAPRKALEIIELRAWRRDDFRFHAVNLWFTLVSGAIFVGSGLLMWFPDNLSDAVLDVSAELHRAFAYALYAVIPLHLVSSRIRIVASVRGWWSRVRGRGGEARR